MQDPDEMEGITDHAISPEMDAVMASQVAGALLARNGGGQTANGNSRKRRKGPDGQHIPAEPRRLRRSHEACARCRSKKIKCDSKHPRCTACASAGVPCNQEDRYRHQLTPRGHTERLERQIEQLTALVKLRMPDFDINNIDEVCEREGIIIPGEPMGQSPPVGWYNASRPGEPAEGSKYSYSVPPPGYGPPYFMAAPPPGPGYPYPPFLPHLHPDLQGPVHQLRHHLPDEGPPSGGHDLEVKGQDPRSMDMSSAQSMSKAFGVSAQVMEESGGYAGSSDREDLAVGSGALTSGRDKPNGTIPEPRDPTIWIKVHVRTGNEAYPTHGIWLPRDRKKVNQIADIYFRRLNPHRPVYVQQDFDIVLDKLYKQLDWKGEVEGMLSYDPGFVCSFYLIMALGTLSELSHKAAEIDDNHHYEGTKVGEIPKILLPEGWPEHAEFFERALIVKADLRVTVSSLQALILLHWYLYIERQGRSLWRLVGHLVRLSTELGLHHDPTTQVKTFSEAECQLRIRLWAIVMIHDRGTSILLGRPLAISPSDSNTSRPKQPVYKGGSKHHAVYSDHFVQSSGIVDIQADIVMSLYTPNKHTPDAIVRHARRITNTMVEYRNQLPESYQPFFKGGEWPRTIPNGVVDNNGLTLLKYWIARILLLRVLFSYEELKYDQRLHALTDAIQTAHNIILAHKSLLNYPDVAFFVSPIPIHIASMVILYGHMSNVACLQRQAALEDVWLGLTMLPRLRWRWDRKDMQAQHPLIEKLAEKVFAVTLSEMRLSCEPVLQPELSWDNENFAMSPTSPHGNKQQGHSNSAAGNAQNVNSPGVQNGMQHGYGGGQYHGNSAVASPTAAEANFPAIPVKWFYPSSRGPYWDQDDPSNDESRANDDANSAIDMVLPPIPPKMNPQDLGSIGCESDEAYLNEERDENVHPTHMNAWIQHMEQRELGSLWTQEPLIQQPQPRHLHGLPSR